MVDESTTKFVEQAEIALLDTPTRSLQALVDGICLGLQDFGIAVVSLYSLVIGSEKSYVLIASSNEDAAAKEYVLRQNDDGTYINIESGRYIVIFNRKPEHIPFSLLERICDVQFRLTMSEKRSFVRRLMVEHSYLVRDVNSLSFKLVGALFNTIIYCDDISVYVRDKANIILASTSSKLKTLDKKDISFTVKAIDPVVESVLFSKYINEESTINKTKYELVFDIKNIRNRLYWPITTLPEKIDSTSSPHIHSYGVMSVTNFYRQGINSRWATKASQYDRDILGYICEILAGLMRQYNQAQKTISDIRKITHGIGSGINVSIKYATHIRDRLYIDDDEYLEGYKLKIDLTDILKTAGVLSEVGKELLDLNAFLNDLHAQFEKVQLNHVEKKIISNIHSTILMPAVRLAPSIAKVNNKQVPLINSLKKEMSLKLPAVVGDADAILSVLRNLIENAVKYTKNETPRIEITFEVEQEWVNIFISDFGIGIDNKDSGELFSEGFRADAAKVVNNRGAGMGLAYCRHVMTAIGGRIEFIPMKDKTRFKVSLRRAQ